MRGTVHHFAAALIALSPVSFGCGPKAAASALEVKTSWCPEHFEQGPGDTCFALPAKKHDARLLLYLAGAPDPVGAKLEFSVVAAALDKGYAVILAHGQRGACGFSSDVKEGNCWPMEDEKEMATLTDGWEQALWQVTALLEGDHHPRFVLAYREGASFATRLASKSMLNAGPNPPRNLRVDGLALVAYPGTHPVPHFPAQLPLAVLEEESTQSEALKDELARDKWSHVRCNRSQAPLSAADVDAAGSVLGEILPPPPPPTPAKGKKPHGKKPTDGPGKPPEPLKGVRTPGCVVES